MDTDPRSLHRLDIGRCTGFRIDRIPGSPPHFKQIPQIWPEIRLFKVVYASI